MAVQATSVVYHVVEAQIANGGPSYICSMPCCDVSWSSSFGTASRDSVHDTITSRLNMTDTLDIQMRWSRVKQRPVFDSIWHNSTQTGREAYFLLPFCTFTNENKYIWHRSNGRGRQRYSSGVPNETHSLLYLHNL